ncbi:canalicular multispecific organic anion transporter 1 [Chaetoceros tenuissimus]|uniref:Canalicular multispecific organic anion transporter 1 n=1 Tax=Chaetoceros tenuissimus TaxID=426638 RepID=A0AAD3D099_9STRA|nr:canalicular multispecific organic anion transporter 1 [Chaetoceros tenuissimus]
MLYSTSNYSRAFIAGLTAALLFTFCFLPSDAFLTSLAPAARHHHTIRKSHTALYSNKRDSEEDIDQSKLPSNADILASLNQRIYELNVGIGKRYIVRIQQRGFLNVHSDPFDPFDVTNVVGKLKEGQIVKSMKPNKGDWVYHDGQGGGWSIAKFNGFTWLEPID